MKKRKERPPFYGLMAEFDNPTDVVARRARRPRSGLPAARRLLALSD